MKSSFLYKNIDAQDLVKSVATKGGTTEAGIKRNWASHLYIVMGQEQHQGSGNRIIRVYYNPNIILIWLGAIIMALGGILSLLE